MNALGKRLIARLEAREWEIPLPSPWDRWGNSDRGLAKVEKLATIWAAAENPNDFLGDGPEYDPYTPLKEQHRGR